jgi:hypothetical protein
MRKVKLFSVALVIVFFFSNVSIIPGSRHFIQVGANEAWAEPITYTVANQPYDVSGTGGSKLTRLSDGSLITCAIWDNGLAWYKSTDNGRSWSELFRNTSNWINRTGLALCSYGTNVYTIATVSSGSQAYFWKFDAAAQITLPNVIPLNYYDQTAFGLGCSITVDSNGILYAAWCCKDISLSRSFNIRVAKSVNGGSSWDWPTRLTSVNEGSIYEFYYPCLAMCKNNLPILLFTNKSSPDYGNGLWCRRYNGTDWIVEGADSGRGINIQVLSGWYSSSFFAGQQYWPSATVSSDGVIHVAWNGSDLSDGGNNIRYTKSSNNGLSWDNPIKLTSGSQNNYQNASISSDNSNNIYVLWHGCDSVDSIYSQIKMVKKVNGSWGSVNNITNATGHQYYPQVCKNLLNFDCPYFIWQDNSAGAIRFMGTPGLPPIINVISPSQNGTLFLTPKTTKRSV